MGLLLALKQKVGCEFGRFWVRWPRKVAKLEAEKAWKQVVTPEDEPLIHSALDWQLPMFERRDPEHIPHAATWLRGRRWDDEKPATAKAPLTDEQKRTLARIQAHLPTTTHQPSAEWLARMQQMREGEES